MIYDKNGQIYQPQGSLNQYQVQSGLDLFNQWDSEVIRLGGSPIFYYEVFLQAQSIDPVYLEDRSKLFSNFPITLYALYEPQPSTAMQGSFGLDSPDEVIFELNYQEVLNLIGHMPKRGSRIHTPHLKEDWEISELKTGKYKLWSVLRLQLICRRFQESSTTSDGKVTEKSPKYEIL